MAKHTISVKTGKSLLKSFVRSIVALYGAKTHE